MHTCIPQPRHHSLTHRHLLGQRSTVLRCFVARQKHGNLIGPLRQRRQPHLQTHTGVVPKRNGQNAGGQATQLFLNLHLPSQCLQLFGTTAIRMKQQNGVAATCLRERAQKRVHPLPHVHRCGQRIADGSRRADRCAGSATHTQMRVDHDAATLAFWVGNRVGITALLTHGFTLEPGITADSHRRTNVNAR